MVKGLISTISDVFAYKCTLADCILNKKSSRIVGVLIFKRMLSTSSAPRLLQRNYHIFPSISVIPSDATNQQQSNKNHLMRNKCLAAHVSYVLLPLRVMQVKRTAHLYRALITAPLNKNKFCTVIQSNFFDLKIN